MKQPVARKSLPKTRLSYLAVNKFWIVVETPLNRSEIERTRFGPICGHHPGHFGLGLVRFGGRFGAGLESFGPHSGPRSTPNDPDRTSDNLIPKAGFYVLPAVPGRRATVHV